MKASELIDLLSQYNPDMDVPVSFTEAEGDDTGIRVASCSNEARTRCYQNIVELAQEGVIVLDPAGRVTYMNPFMQTTLGYSALESLGKPLTRFLPLDQADLALAHLQRQRALSHNRFSLRMISRDRRLHWVRVSATTIPSADGRYRGALLAVTDLTHRQVHEQRTQDQESLGRKVERIAEQLESLKALRMNLMEELHELEKFPRIDAKPYWHQNRYLYLVCPQRNGKRVRNYIGAHPEKVSAALVAVRRELRYQDVNRELAQIEAQIRTASFKLDSFLWELAQLPPNLHKLVN